MQRIHIRLAAVSALALVTASAVIACSGDDTTTPASTDGGSTGDGSSAGNDSGGGGGDSGSTDTLYKRLGGHDGIRKAVEAIVAAELADTEIASFFGQVGMPGHPNADQIEECLTIQLGSVAGGTETYPVMLDATHGSFQCRSMKAAHVALHIPASTFDKFVTIAAGKLKALGVADADITTIGTVLVGTKSDIVDPAAMYDAGPG